MFVVLSHFIVANDLAEEVKQAFRNRAGLVDREPGFIRLEVISPLDDPHQIWLITYWKDEPSYQSWHHSHKYHDSHKGIPKGLKLVPGSPGVRFFEHISS
jgi:heme-degrading monooxygenase HmoA